MAAEAELQEMSHDDWIATLALVGMSDDKIQQELLSKIVPPTLEETLTMCRNEEKGRLGVRDLQRPEGVATAAYKARTPYQKGKDAEQGASVPLSSEEDREQTRREKCRDCGFKHGNERRCPAQTVCHLHHGNEKSLNAAGIGASLNIGVGIYARSSGRFLGNIDFVPDTGAQGTVAGMELLNKLGIHQSSLNPVRHRFVGVAGKSLRPVGAKQVRLKLEGRECEEDLTFCENIRHQYLSFNACKSLGIVNHDFPLPLKQSWLAILGTLTELDV
eukprot:TCALIF_08502-PA protein Name:"Protein of unknown function" AED:0.31 eAED:0.31 QI:0/0/0/1/1/1/2/0/273